MTNFARYFLSPVRISLSHLKVHRVTVGYDRTLNSELVTGELSDVVITGVRN